MEGKSVGMAIVKGLVSGLVAAAVVIVARYLVTGGNNGDFVSTYLLSTYGILCLVCFPIVGVLYNLFAVKKQKKD